MSEERFRNAVEAALFAAGRPLAVDDIVQVFADSEWHAERSDVRQALAALAELWAERGLELVEVSNGWRFQVRREYSGWLGRLWSEKPPRYSRALLETLAIIAYRQPVTRGEIEDIRGVAVSPSILRTLQERDWIRTLGHKEVPGRPELLGTTRQFLDDFSLPSLEALPPLAEIRDLDAVPDDLFPETRQGGAPPADGAGPAPLAAEPGGSPTEVGAGDEEPEEAEPTTSEPTTSEAAPPAADAGAGTASERAENTPSNTPSNARAERPPGDDEDAGEPPEEDEHGPSSPSTA